VEVKDAFVGMKEISKADVKENYGCMLFGLVTLGLRSL